MDRCCMIRRVVVAFTFAARLRSRAKALHPDVRNTPDPLYISYIDFSISDTYSEFTKGMEPRLYLGLFVAFFSLFRWLNNLKGFLKSFRPSFGDNKIIIKINSEILQCQNGRNMSSNKVRCIHDSSEALHFVKYWRNLYRAFKLSLSREQTLKDLLSVARIFY